MGKTEKEKAKDKAKASAKDSKRDKVPKILKAGASSGGKSKKKKWSKSKSKEKVNNNVYWAKPVWDKLMKDVVGKESYISPSVISDKLKVSVSLARQAIRALREDNKIAPSTEYHSRFCTFVRTAKFAAEQAAEKKEAPAKGEGKKGKTQQA